MIGKDHNANDRPRHCALHQHEHAAGWELDDGLTRAGNSGARLQQMRPPGGPSDKMNVTDLQETCQELKVRTVSMSVYLRVRKGICVGFSFQPSWNDLK